MIAVRGVTTDEIATALNTFLLLTPVRFAILYPDMVEKTGAPHP
jgi:hypothetical protein